MPYAKRAISFLLTIGLLLTATQALLIAQDKAAREPIRWPGMVGKGQMLLPTQWTLAPVGKQIKLGDFPVHLEVHPSLDFAAILHCGYGEHEIVIVNLKTEEIVSRVGLREAFYGLAWSPDGKKLWASGASEGVAHQFDFADGYLTAPKKHRVSDLEAADVVGGLCTTRDGAEAIVCETYGKKLSILSAETGKEVRSAEFGENDYPYTAIEAPDRQRILVSLWGGAAVAEFDRKTLAEKARWKTPSHPTEMIFSPSGELLYVACANSNEVVCLDAKTGETRETIWSALYPKAANGSTPNSLALSPDGKVLLVANADNNNIAVFDVSTPRHAKSLGFIPVGWYPTSVRFSRDGKKLLVCNGKGLMSKGNASGPNPLLDKPATVREYIGGLFRGTLSIIDSPSPAEMADYTKTAFACSPLLSSGEPVAKKREADNPIPENVGGASPIKHCIYIIKENRTYDQIFGDIPEGNGDKNLCIFGERVTPNHHALVRQFVLLDNFYVESEVSADGHEWTMAAYATDFVEKSWPLSYRPGNPTKSKVVYPSEGGFEIARPAGGYFWDRCKEAGVSYRSYGEFIENGATPNDPSKARVATLEGHFDSKFRGYDLDYPDVKRTDRFLEELAEFQAKGDMPSFIVLRLGNDHTFGTRPGKRTPTAMVADNDLALGRFVEGVSKSKFWKDTAIFVVEDDAQNGSDHVDAHRTVALVISPYTKRGVVDSTMYSTSSMLRTMELILGLQPMSQFDAAATPMYASFTAKLDLKPYVHLPANVDLNEMNTQASWGAKQSLEMDFSKEDAADDLLLNDIVWRSVRGPKSPMPPPVRAAFVFAENENEEEEDERERAKKDKY
jgi:YVTN family beta-propeller protein